MARQTRRDERWYVQRRRQRVVRILKGVPVIGLGQAEVWDYGDLVRLRQAAGRLLAEGYRQLGIDMSRAVYLPGGFMNMLCEWTDRDIDVFLYQPRENVRQMLWFREFMEPARDEVFRVIKSDERDPLCDDPHEGSESGDDIPQYDFSC